MKVNLSSHADDSNTSQLTVSTPQTSSIHAAKLGLPQDSRSRTQLNRRHQDLANASNKTLQLRAYAALQASHSSIQRKGQFTENFLSAAPNFSSSSTHSSNGKPIQLFVADELYSQLLNILSGLTFGEDGEERPHEFNGETPQKREENRLKFLNVLRAAAGMRDAHLQAAHVSDAIKQDQYFGDSNTRMATAAVYAIYASSSKRITAAPLEVFASIAENQSRRSRHENTDMKIEEKKEKRENEEALGESVSNEAESLGNKHSAWLRAKEVPREDADAVGMPTAEDLNDIGRITSHIAIANNALTEIESHFTLFKNRYPLLSVARENWRNPKESWDEHVIANESAGNNREIYFDSVEEQEDVYGATLADANKQIWINRHLIEKARKLILGGSFVADIGAKKAYKKVTPLAALKFLSELIGEPVRELEADSDHDESVAAHDAEQSPSDDDEQVLLDGDEQVVVADDDGHVLANDDEQVLANDGEEVLANDGEEVLANDGEEVLANDDEQVLANDGEEVLANDVEEVLANDGEQVAADGNDDE